MQHLPAGTRVTVIDDATPGSEVREVASKYGNVQYRRNDVNQGFVRTCNQAALDLRDGEDLLLLNSDTEVTPGFLEEMQAVLDMDSSYAVVSPRSNDATLLSVPLYQKVPPEAGFSLWICIRDLLPRHFVIPTAVGFCMLIRASAIRVLGLFDEIYGAGYNEENDFVCRLQRHGYSAVSANRAFVFHHGSSSFGPRREELEARNRKILLARYPEYEREIGAYFRYGLDPVDHFSPLFTPHAPTLLYDVTHVGPRHSEEAWFALRLLRDLSADVHVLIGDETRQFHAGALQSFRCITPPVPLGRMFDVAFRPAPLIHWQDVVQLNRLAPKLAAIGGTKSDDVDSALTFEPPSLEPATIENPGDAIVVLGEGYGHLGIGATQEFCTSSTRVTAVVDNDTYVVDLPGVEWRRAGAMSPSAWREILEGASKAIVPGRLAGLSMAVMEAVDAGIPVEVNGAMVRTPQWETVSEECAGRIQELLARPLDISRLRRRWSRLQDIERAVSLAQKHDR